MSWEEKYVGLPYIDGGRSEAGVDCWGLAYLVFLRELHIELPVYGEISARDLAHIAETIKGAAVEEPWLPLPRQDIAPFDLMIMHRRGEPVHVGLIASGNRLLHTEEKIQSVLIPIDHPSLRQRPAFFLRHRQFDHANVL